MRYKSRKRFKRYYWLVLNLIYYDKNFVVTSQRVFYKKLLILVDNIKKVGRSVARCPGPRSPRIQAASANLLSLAFIKQPDNGGTIPDKVFVFELPSNLFRPHIWWRRRVPPPGPNNLLHKAFIILVAKQHFHYTLN